MKKRILSLVLCAALLLSLCLFMGAGVAVDAPATEDFVPAVNFTNVAPLVQTNAQAAGSPARAAQLRAVSAAPAAPERVQQDALVTSKTATPVPNSDGTYKIRLESYSTRQKGQQNTSAIFRCYTATCHRLASDTPLLFCQLLYRRLPSTLG